MMHQPVAYSGLMNIARLWVANLEPVVRTMSVAPAFQIVMQEMNIIHQTQLKYLHIDPLALTFDEFLPCLK